MTSSIRAALGLIVAIGSLALFPSSGYASADLGTPVGATEFVNINSDKCMEVYNWSLQNYANVDQWTCYGNPNQLWYVYWLGGSEYTFVNENSGKCLDVHGGSKANGGNVDQYSCNGTGAQIWVMRENVNGAAVWVNQGSGLALEVYGQSKANGANVDQWSYWGGSNQKWFDPWN